MLRCTTAGAYGETRPTFRSLSTDLMSRGLPPLRRARSQSGTSSRPSSLARNVMTHRNMSSHSRFWLVPSVCRPSAVRRVQPKGAEIGG